MFLLSVMGCLFVKFFQLEQSSKHVQLQRATSERSDSDQLNDTDKLWLYFTWMPVNLCMLYLCSKSRNVIEKDRSRDQTVIWTNSQTPEQNAKRIEALHKTEPEISFWGFCMATAFFHEGQIRIFRFFGPRWFKCVEYQSSISIRSWDICFRNFTQQQHSSPATKPELSNSTVQQQNKSELFLNWSWDFFCRNFAQPEHSSQVTKPEFSNSLCNLPLHLKTPPIQWESPK